MVHAYLLHLFGLDALRTFGLSFDFKNHLHTSSEHPSDIPINYISGHAILSTETLISLEMEMMAFGNDIGKPSVVLACCRTKELKKVHERFQHASPQKLYMLLRRADPHRATHSVRKKLEEVSAALNSCRPFSSPRFRFRACISPEILLFNQEVSVVLFWLQSRRVFHVV